MRLKHHQEALAAHTLEKRLLLNRMAKVAWEFLVLQCHLPTCEPTRRIDDELRMF